MDAENIDINGCLVGPSGEKVCPLGAFGADGQSRVLARGNKGPGQTGSNGNAGPLNAAGQAIDPATELFKKQQRGQWKAQHKALQELREGLYREVYEELHELGVMNDGDVPEDKHKTLGGALKSVFRRKK